MKLPRNFVIKACGIALAILGLVAWQIAQTSSRVRAEVGSQSSQSLAAALPVASNLASGALAGTDIFCNSTPIVFGNNLPPASPPSASTPYPSDITVAGMTGTVTKVTVTLNNINHTFPDDIDVLLVGPTGANAILMSDVGGNPDANNVTLTLDDAAALSLPDAGPLVSGAFKPTNVGITPDPFPAPAPAGPYGTALSAFNVTNPNGTWRLYVADDLLGDVGSIAGGWCLTITTADTPPCTLTCPENIDQANDPTQCGAMVSYPAPTTTGTCGTVTCTPPSGSFFFVGTTTVTCISATGSQCSFTVTVNNVNCPLTDFCNPTSISLQTNSVTTPYPSSIGVSGVPGVITKVTVTLNNITHTFPDDIDVLLVSPTGANAIIMSDVGGNPDANNVTLTLDDAAPSPLPDIGPLVSGTFKPTNNAPAETFPPPAPAPSGGSLLSAFNGADPNGVWRLFVIDDSLSDFGSIAGGWCLTITTEVPCTITCPANVNISNTTGQCGSTAFYTPLTTGDCGTVGCTPASGSVFPVGTTTVTCTTSSGPSCSFTVTVNDVENPIVTCPANQSLTPPPGQCSAIATYEATATDNCPGVSVVTCSPPTGSAFAVGTTTVTCSATDASGNQGSCSFTVTVTDGEAPVVTCPANKSVPATAGECEADVTFTATALDNCSGVIPATCVPASGSSFPVGTTTVTCTATDTAGNQGSCSFTVMVTDNQNPVVTCPANKSISAALGLCEATTTYTATAEDNCPGVGAATCSPPSGSSFPVGTTTVTCTATDAAGNQGSCSFTVTVTDNQNPVVTCPANKSVIAPSGACSASVTFSAAAADNCPGVSAANCSPPSGTAFPVGTTTVTCSATDASGNQGSCSFTVTVTDTTPPVISCPPNITTVDNAPGACGAMLNPGTATATDNCAVASVVDTRSDNAALGAIYPVGTTVITWKATDASGNMTTCQQTVTVTNPSPVVTITGPPSGSIFPVNSAVAFTSTFTDNLGDTHTAQWMFDATTASAPVVEPTVSTPGTANLSFTFTTPGVYIVQLKVEDDCGNITIANTVNGEPAMVVIFDPEGEFVTGGGWINSPAGAYPANPTQTGKANFGFNAKYHNGDSVPRGETEFRFGNFKFHSTNYQWLVIQGPRFQFRGTGKVNGSGNYGFLLTGIDGSVAGGGGSDKFRIKIWDINNGNVVVYDNEISTPDSANPVTLLGGGNLVIHH
jgi:subtilisin-like proprotein convertase family protein